MVDKCRITAAKGRTRLQVHGEVNSQYVQALQAMGWTVTATPVAAPDPQAFLTARQRAEAEADAGW